MVYHECLFQILNIIEFNYRKRLRSHYYFEKEKKEKRMFFRKKDIFLLFRNFFSIADNFIVAIA